MVMRVNRAGGLIALWTAALFATACGNDEDRRTQSPSTAAGDGGAFAGDGGSGGGESLQSCEELCQITAETGCAGESACLRACFARQAACEVEAGELFRCGATQASVSCVADFPLGIPVACQGEAVALQACFSRFGGAAGAGGAGE